MKILWKRGEILFSTIFCYLILDFCVKTRIRFSLRDKRLFEITKVEITRVDCIMFFFLIKMWFYSGYILTPVVKHIPGLYSHSRMVLLKVQKGLN